MSDRKPLIEIEDKSVEVDDEGLPRTRYFIVDGFDGVHYRLMDVLMQQIMMDKMIAKGQLPIPNPRPCIFVKSEKALEVGKPVKGTLVGFYTNKGHIPNFSEVD